MSLVCLFAWYTAAFSGSTQAVSALATVKNNVAVAAITLSSTAVKQDGTRAEVLTGSTKLLPVTSNNALAQATSDVQLTSFKSFIKTGTADPDVAANYTEDSDAYTANYVAAHFLVTMAKNTSANQSIKYNLDVTLKSGETAANWRFAQKQADGKYDVVALTAGSETRIQSNFGQSTTDDTTWEFIIWVDGIVITDLVSPASYSNLLTFTLSQYTGA